MFHHHVDVRRVDADAGTHRRRQRDALEVLALGRRRLRLDDAVDERVRVGDQRIGGERRLADRRVDDAGLVDAELHLAGLDFLDRLGDVDGDRAGLRVRHQAARAEHLAELADRAHHVGRRDDGVEVHEAALDLLDHLFAADDVGAGFLRLPSASRRRRSPARACSCRGRAAARRCRAPSGRRASDRRRAAATARRSRRTSRT